MQRSNATNGPTQPMAGMMCASAEATSTSPDKVLPPEGLEGQGGRRVPRPAARPLLLRLGPLDNPRA
ncbi:MAG: hypothetical protein AMXMBFR64_54670 [Myxococcales bacterium]